MNIRFAALAALVAAMLFGTGASSQANYDVTTATSMTVTSGSLGTATIALTDFSQTNIPLTLFTIPAVSVTLGGSYSTSATLTITDVITITNPSGGPTTGSVTETATYTLSAGGLVALSASLSAGSVTVSGTTFLVTTPQATSTTFNQTANNAAVSAIVIPQVTSVPEPASIAMLGLGLVSVGGLALRRRMAK